jgi:hypothetical protein
VLAGEGKLKEAQQQVRAFLKKLCEVRVLDPACGSGNFLYVTLEHLKRLEGEVLNLLDELGDTQGRLELQGVSVDPHQLLGIELNPRAAEIAEMVLWIGYLQWHFRTRGQIMPPQPVLKDFHNIECRDAVLAYDRVEFVKDERGVPVSRWDGTTYKKHPVTGEDVPDDTARVPLERYVNPRKAEWPQADFVIGNPPFIGKGKIREALGDGYVEALRTAWSNVPDSADFVMYWWDHAAELTRIGKLRRFGLITTNSLRQIFNRRIVERHLNAKPPLVFAFGIAHHPWVDSANGAAVRIAMTVGTNASVAGELLEVVSEVDAGEDALQVEFKGQRGTIGADLRIGASIAAAVPLTANSLIASTGFILGGRGFVLTSYEAESWRQSKEAFLVFPLCNGEDLLNKTRNAFVIDAHGFDEAELRNKAPKTWQRLYEKVYPERQQNRDARLRQRWWLFRRSNEQVRAAIESLSRFIVTVETAKHRVFTFLDQGCRPEHVLIVIGTQDIALLGVLSSQAHVTWALATGGTLEDRPRYNKSRCFETFPFPDVKGELKTRIRDLAEQLDGHRKRQQAQYADLTLTGMYNVLEKLKAGEALSAKEKVIHEHGLVAVLKTLHDEIDRAVLHAYGWNDLAPLMDVVNGNVAASGLPQSTLSRAGEGAKILTRDDAKRALDDALLERLVALNAERAAEEQRGLIRWLRPEFQIPASGLTDASTAEQLEIASEDKALAVKSGARRAWPATLPEQVKAVAEILTAARGPLAEDAIAAYFSGRGAWKKRLPQIIDTLVAVGRVRRRNDKLAVIA